MTTIEKLENLCELFLKVKTLYTDNDDGYSSYCSVPDGFSVFELVYNIQQYIDEYSQHVTNLDILFRAISSFNSVITRYSDSDLHNSTPQLSGIINSIKDFPVSNMLILTRKLTAKYDAEFVKYEEYSEIKTNPVVQDLETIKLKDQILKLGPIYLGYSLLYLEDQNKGSSVADTEFLNVDTLISTLDKSDKQKIELLFTNPNLLEVVQNIAITRLSDKVTIDNIPFKSIEL